MCKLMFNPSNLKNQPMYKWNFNKMCIEIYNNISQSKK